jgi:glycosyltransferase involved in cell wall biosynthesis
LAKKMAWALANPRSMAAMGRKARSQYEAEFSADVNYRQLMAIYEDVIREVQETTTGTAQA